MAQEALLRTHGLTMRFDGLTAVDGVDITLRRGEIHALLGPNGAGKTTLFNLIAGALRPTAGSIRFADKDVTALRPDWRCRAGIARTFQITQPFARLTVEQNVMCGALARFSSMRRVREEVQGVIDAVGLAAKREAPAGTLSTGQRKRLELARALATAPSLLLIDELSGGIDQPSLPALEALVRGLNRDGLTVLMIDHNLEFVGRLAQRVSFLAGGQLLAEGTMAQIHAHAAVRDLYLGRARA
ncbi:ABC transporter ATP-binding protein [Variovorax sp. LjRoot175]|uniref:ABC transporter ATP-binding protein n=1 Tax=Variovorax sp. LjRoot175 TaxID=3342276 RepID=UPI003ECE108F